MSARHLFPTLFLLLVALVVQSVGQTQKPANAEEDARRDGLQWLQLVDKARYERAWEQSTPLLQAAVKKEAFAQTVRNMRQPLGNIKRRSLKEAKHSTEVAGAPEGHYVILQFTTQFAEHSATEVLTMSLVDGSWKPTGYFVR